MTARALQAEEVGLPRFAFEHSDSDTPFDLSSHQRAREALEFGLRISDPGFNIFVVGEDRSGRMTETYRFLDRHLEGTPVPDDWVYLNNFPHTYRPRPYRLQPGTGRHLQYHLAAAVGHLRESLSKAFTSDEYREQVEKASADLRTTVETEMLALRKEADAADLTLIETESGTLVAAKGAEGKPVAIEELPEKDREAVEGKAQDIAGRLQELNRKVILMQAALADRVKEINRQFAEEVVRSLIDPLQEEFSAVKGLTA